MSPGYFGSSSVDGPKGSNYAANGINCSDHQLCIRGKQNGHASVYSITVNIQEGNVCSQLK
jgi:hypothetical protein